MRVVHINANTSCFQNNHAPPIILVMEGSLGSERVLSSPLPASHSSAGNERERLWFLCALPLPTQRCVCPCRHVCVCDWKHCQLGTGLRLWACGSKHETQPNSTQSILSKTQTHTHTVTHTHTHTHTLWCLPHSAAQNVTTWSSMVQGRLLAKTHSHDETWRLTSRL